MRWLVEAADTKTGLETEITIEAVTEAEAERLAHYNGLLVSKIYKASRKAPAPVVPYAKPAIVVTSGPPEFTRLVRQARATRRLGVGLSVVGWLVVAGAVGDFGYQVARDLWGDWSQWAQSLSAATAHAWLAAAAGAAAVAAGSALRLLAAMSLVLRVAARQSHRPKASADEAPEAPAEFTGAVADAAA